MKNKENSKNESNDGSASGFDAIMGKQYLEDTTTILLLLAQEKADSLNGDINPIDSEACKFYNGEVHDLMNYYMLMILEEMSNTETNTVFKDKLKDFLIIYESHVILELFELFPDESHINSEHYLIKHTTRQLEYLFRIYHMLASDREFKELFKSLGEDTESPRNIDDEDMGS